MEQNSILCTICARGGSKGVLNKNIRVINGKPLIAYSIETAKQTGLFEHIVISTDSDEIASVAMSFGAEVFFKRPSELASDTAAKLPVIRHAFTESEKFYGMEFRYLIDLDATSPLRIADDITGAYKLLIDGGYDNIITAMPSRRSPYFNMVELTIDNRVELSKKLESKIIRRQDAPKCYDMNASIYAWKRSALLNSESVISNNTGLFVMPEERSIDIDSQLDFEFVSMLLQRK